MMNNSLLLVWKSPITEHSFIVGKLSYADKFYFEYTEEIGAAKEAGWKRLKAFPEKKTYESEMLFPVFSSRLPDPKRRDIATVLKKYGLNAFDEFELLRRSGAKLPIDTYEFVDPNIC